MFLRLLNRPRPHSSLRLRLFSTPSSLSHVFVRRHLPPLSSLSVISAPSIRVKVSIKPEWRTDAVLTFSQTLGSLDSELALSVTHDSSGCTRVSVDPKPAGSPRLQNTPSDEHLPPLGFGNANSSPQEWGQVRSLTLRSLLNYWAVGRLATHDRVEERGHMGVGEARDGRESR